MKTVRYSDSHGHSLEITFAQVVALRLGVSLDNVEIVYGDTGHVELDKTIEKAKAAAADIEFKGGTFTVAVTDRSKSFGEIVGPPPRNAKFALLLFLSKEDREVQLGDLEETYYKIAEEFGSRRANFWYRSQVVRSLGPWIWTLIKRGGIASGGLFSLSKVTEFFGRLLGG